MSDVPLDYERLWKDLSRSATRMQNMLNEMGVCDDCGQRCDDGPFSDPIATGTCKECGEPIGVMSSCCWSGPDAIWLHRDIEQNDHDAEPRPEDEERAHQAAIAKDGDQEDPLANLRGWWRKTRNAAA